MSSSLYSPLRRGLVGYPHQSRILQQSGDDSGSPDDPALPARGQRRISGPTHLYSSFEHVVAGLFLRPEDMVLIVEPDPFSLYCDPSGSEREPLTVVGSALATVKGWNDFIPRWNDVLKRHKVKYFRASEFASSTGAFVGWKGNQKHRNDFSFQLLEVMASTIQWWFGVTILQSDYEKADLVYQVRESFSPFAICSDACIQEACEWRKRQQLDYLPLKYFFESGDDHWGQMSDWIKRKFGEPPIPGSKIEPPFQAADFIAYEVRKAYMELHVKDAHLLWKGFRKALSLMNEIAGAWGHITDTGIRIEMRRLGIPKRM